MTWARKVRIMITVTLLMAFGFTMMLLKSLYIPCAILVGVWVFHIVYFVFFVKNLKEDQPMQVKKIERSAWSISFSRQD